MALTDATTFTTGDGNSIIEHYEVASAEVIFRGAYVVENDAGFAVNPVDTANFIPLGFVDGFNVENTDQNSVTGDGTEAQTVAVDVGGLTLKRINVVNVSGQGNVTNLVYVTDENTFTNIATTNLAAVGRITRFYSGTTVDVKFFSLDEMVNN